MRALPFSRHLGKMLLQAWRKTRTSGRPRTGLLKLHFVIVDPTASHSVLDRYRHLVSPPSAKNAERRRSDHIHKNDTFSRWKTVATTAAAMAPWTSLELRGSRRGQLLAWKNRFQGGVFTRGLFAVTDRRLGASHKRHGNMLKMSLICQCNHSGSSSPTSARFVARATTGMSKRNRPRWCLSCCV